MSGSGGPQPEVFVRFVRTKAFDDPVRAARAWELLSTEEQLNLTRLSSTDARRDYLGAHTLARVMLADVASCDPRVLRFDARPRQRPRIVDPTAARRFDVSISHADGVALCVTATAHVVGGDVESLRNVGPDALRVAATVCNDREMRVLHSLSAAERADAFLRVWTVKEAVLKATGLASRLDPRYLSVALDGDGPPGIEFDPDMHEDAARWHLAIWRIPPSHVAAVAVSGPLEPHLPVRLEPP